MKPHLAELIKRSQQSIIRLEARNAAFEKKDVLKSRGYRWDPAERVWYTEALESDINKEQGFLSEEIYHGPSQAREVILAKGRALEGLSV